MSALWTADFAAFRTVDYVFAIGYVASVVGNVSAHRLLHVCDALIGGRGGSSSNSSSVPRSGLAGFFLRYVSAIGVFAFAHIL
jgi:hypothetical protein